MSECVETCRDMKTRARLRLGVAIAAFTASFGSSGAVNAREDTEAPVWIELGGQLTRIGGGEQFYVPPFLAAPATSASLNVPTLLRVQQRPEYGKGIAGSLLFRPRGTDWVFSISARYDRLNKKKHAHQQTALLYSSIHHPTGVNETRAADANAKRSETTAVLDFIAGRDVGIGSLGISGSSTVGLGLRFAQFAGIENGSAYAELPNVSLPPPKYLPNVRKHHFTAMADASRSFHGIGPSLSWQASSLIEGAPSGAQIFVDWGLNGAMLFGRQKVSLHSAVSGYYKAILFNPFPSVVVNSYTTNKGLERAKSVIVPNIGGFVGASLRFPNAQVKVGYRADLFFRAIDGGIGNRKTYDRDFYGPFATISIGLGG